MIKIFNIFIFLFSFNFALNHAVAQDSSQTGGSDSNFNFESILNNPEDIQKFLLNPIPTAYGQSDFFRNITEEDSLFYTKSIIDEQLINAANHGQEFRDWYLKTLKDQVSDISYNYLLGYEGYARDRILSLLGLKKSTKNNRTMTAIEAENLALYNTRLRFGLPSNITLQQIIQDRFTSISSESAYVFYQREYYKALVMVELPGQTKRPWTFQEIQQQLILEIRKAREENFLSALKLSLALRHQFNYTITTTDGEKITKDYEIEQIYFFNKSHIKSLDHLTLKDTLSNRLDQMLGYFSLGKRKNDQEIAQDFYLPRTYSPKWTNLEVEIKWRNGLKARISESDFSLIVNALRLPDTLDLFKGHTWEKRFLIEASKRDASLADLEQVILNQNHNSVELLIKNIDSRLAIFENPKPKVRYTLTENIRSEEDVLKDHFFNNVRWSGWAIHPDLWRLKSEIAKSTSKPYFQDISELSNQDTKPKISKNEKKAIASYEKKQTKLNKHRTASRGMRRTLLLAPIAIWAAVLSGTTTATVQTIKYLKTPYAAINIDLPNGGAQTSNFWSMKKNDDHYIVPKDQATGKDSKPVFTIVYKSAYGQKNIPQYFNILDDGNLPQDVLLDEDIFSEPDSVEQIQINRSKYDEADLVIGSSLKMVGSNNRYGILSLPGYRLTDLELISDYSKVNNHYYTIYEVKNSGLTYVELIREENIIGYVASYAKDNRPVLNDPSFSSLDKSVLLEISAELKKLGATSLSQNLNTQISKQGELGALKLSQTFADSGLYTYRSVNQQSTLDWIYSFFTNKKSENFFSEYNQYLLNGTFYYQCSGSNSILIDTLNLYAEKTNADFLAMPIHGFMYKEGDIIMPNQGHRHTLITHKYQDRTFLSLDGTPSTMDPADTPDQEKPNAPEEPTDTFKDKKNVPEPYKPDNSKMVEVIGVLNRNDLKPREDKKKENEEKDSEPLVRKNEDIDYRLNSLASLDQMLNDLNKTAEQEGQENLFFRQQVTQLARQPGLITLSYAHVIKELLELKINPKLALKILIAKELGWRDVNLIGSNKEHQNIIELRRITELRIEQDGSVGKALVNIFNKSLLETQSLFANIESEILRNGDSPMGFLLAPDWRTGLLNLSNFLKRINYERLLPTTEEPRVENSCVGYLK